MKVSFRMKPKKTEVAAGLLFDKDVAKDYRMMQMRRTGFVIDPRTTKHIARWDLLMVLALSFTAIVTPVEVVYLDEGRYISTLWVVNRVVDLMFTIDIVLTFLLAYKAPMDQGGHWVFNRWSIACHYVCGWFLTDFLSVLPFWLITLQKDDPMGNAKGLAPDGTMDGTGNNSLVRSAVLFRVIKLLRMLKLARVLKASQVIQRVLLDFVMNQWEWTYAVLKMVKLTVMLTIYAHWLACLWGLVSSYMHADGMPTWIGGFYEQYADTHGTADDGATVATPTGLEVYAAALYWSVMTLTSIGYGEYTPVNTTERVLCSIYMLVSGVVWTYAIGSVAAIATTLNPNAIIYENTMDSLNYFMRERELPRTMRMTLRDFFASARRVHQLNDDGDLLDKMSPLLQGTVALAANQRWIQQIWFFRRIHEVDTGVDFIAALAKNLVIRPYVQHERLPVGQLYILRTGMAVKMWRFLGSGQVWGEDMIIDNPELMDHSQAVALTYVEAYTLRRNHLFAVLADYPAAKAVVHKASRRVLMQRAFLKHLCLLNGKAGPRSIALRAQARGFKVVHDVYSTDQKVDRIYAVIARGADGVDGCTRRAHATSGMQEHESAEAEAAQLRMYNPSSSDLVESFVGPAAAAGAVASDGATAAPSSGPAEVDMIVLPATSNLPATSSPRRSPQVEAMGLRLDELTERVQAVLSGQAAMAAQMQQIAEAVSKLQQP